jgi:hypothetical protein
MAAPIDLDGGISNGAGRRLEIYGRLSSKKSSSNVRIDVSISLETDFQARPGEVTALACSKRWIISGDIGYCVLSSSKTRS